MEEYTVKLSQFEGPLDLLLHLIQKSKIDLEDIFVSEITAQYLVYMYEIGEVDMERASAFLSVAATLLYIKSRALLPRREELPGEEGIDPEAELLERLRLYKVYKEAGEHLAEIGEEACEIFYKLPEELFAEEDNFVLEDADTAALYRAFLEVLKREQTRERTQAEVEISKDSFSIRMQKKIILKRLEQYGKISFFSLFGEGATRMEIAVTFVALLELWNAQNIKIRQSRQHGDIQLMAV